MDYDNDRCTCGGEVVYFEDEHPPGEGCSVEGKPWILRCQVCHEKFQETDEKAEIVVQIGRCAIVHAECYLANQSKFELA